MNLEEKAMIKGSKRKLLLAGREKKGLNYTLLDNKGEVENDTYKRCTPTASRRTRNLAHAKMSSFRLRPSSSSFSTPLVKTIRDNRHENPGITRRRASTSTPHEKHAKSQNSRILSLSTIGKDEKQSDVRVPSEKNLRQSFERPRNDKVEKVSSGKNRRQSLTTTKKQRPCIRRSHSTRPPRQKHQEQKEATSPFKRTNSKTKDFSPCSGWFEKFDDEFFAEPHRKYTTATAGATATVSSSSITMTRRVRRLNGDASKKDNRVTSQRRLFQVKKIDDENRGNYDRRNSNNEYYDLTLNQFSDVVSPLSIDTTTKPKVSLTLRNIRQNQSASCRFLQ